jgi:two-component system sensor histidine kinase RegB
MPLSIAPRTPESGAEERFRINIAWLVQARWATVVAQVAAIAAVEGLMGVPLPLGPVLALVAAELATNLACLWWLHHRLPLGEGHVVAVVAIDLTLFSALLFLTGGPANPFSTLYLVHIVLAALVLRPFWSWTLVGFVVLSTGLMFVVHVPLPLLDPHEGGSLHGHHAGDHYATHLHGMWAALALAGSFIVYFVNRTTRALAARESQLQSARELTARNQQLASLATLSAGAAHELASPLSTIAVVAKELHRRLDRAGDKVAVEDARLIREQVDRCRSILDQMAADAGHSAGELAVRAPVGEVVDAALVNLPDAKRVRVHFATGVRELMVTVPCRALAQALRSLIKNALDASPGDQRVDVHVSCSNDEWQLVVVDRGTGMPPDVQARSIEPFYTTKEPGSGMGLGLFLAHTVAQRIHGRLELVSQPGQGTTAALSFPRVDATNRRGSP